MHAYTVKTAVGKATIGSARGFPPFRRAPFRRAIVRMGFGVILAAGATIEVRGPLRQSTFSHREITQIRLHSVERPEAPSGQEPSKFCRRDTERARVAPIVVPGREFAQVKGHVPPADIVVSVRDATLRKAPEVVTFNTTTPEKPVVKYFLVAFIGGV